MGLLLMENSVTGGFANTGRALADHSPANARISSQIARNTAKDVGDRLAGILEDARSEAGTAVNRRSKRGESASKGVNWVTAMADQLGASSATDSMLAYTKKNPVKALAVAAVSGVVLYAMIKALTPSRD